MLKFKNSNTKYFVFSVPEGIQPEFSLQKMSGIIVNSVSCKMDENEKRWLIKSEELPAEFTIGKSDGSLIKILIIKREFAEKSWAINEGDNTIIAFSDATIIKDKGNLKLLQDDDPEMQVQIYPVSDYTILSQEKFVQSENKLFSTFRF